MSKPDEYPTERYECGPRFELFFVEADYTGADEDFEESRHWPVVPRIGDTVKLGPWSKGEPPDRRVLGVEWLDYQTPNREGVVTNVAQIIVVLEGVAKVNSR